jgi:membrane protein YqaA with SNARE-associated domain
MTKKKKFLNLAMFLVVLGAGFFVSFWLAEYVSNDAVSQKLIQDFGHTSILIISFVSGLNALVPIPAATFVPIFTEGGISLPVVTILLIIGTMAANLVSFVIGVYGGKITESHYPKLQKKMLDFYQGKEKWLPYFVFCFTAILPLPDEVYLIPLGIIGVKLRQIFIPLLLGTVVYQTLAAFGVQNIFEFF